MTQWLERLLWGVLVVALIATVLVGLRQGWRRRARLQRDIPPPARPTGQVRDWVREPVEGRYLTSTRAGDWLDRIVVHSMGVPSRAALGVSRDGVQISRQSERDIFIPMKSVVSARVDEGATADNDKVESVLVVTWRLGDAEVDTGFRATTPEVHRELASTLASMVSAETANGGKG